MQKNKEIKSRHSWKINPTIRIKNGYNRAKEKEKVKRMIKDAVNYSK